MSNLLPLGTVVRAKIKEAVIDLMIIGYYPVDEKTGEIYNYTAIIYPMGMNLAVGTVLLAEENIEGIIQEGYTSKEYGAILDDYERMVNEVVRDAYIDIFDKIAEEVKNDDVMSEKSKTETRNTGEFG